MSQYKQKLLTGISVIVSLFINFNASATVISDSRDQTVDGENFNFNLKTSNYQAGTSSILTVTVQADFNAGSPYSEDVASVIIEGIDFGAYDINSSAAYNLINYTSGVDNFNTWEFSVDFVLDAATTASMLFDNSLDVLIDFGDDVNVDCGWSGPSNCTPNEGNSPYAAVSYTYTQTVPEPSVMVLMGLGILGFVATRRKSQN